MRLIKPEWVEDNCLLAVIYSMEGYSGVVIDANNNLRLMCVDGFPKDAGLYTCTVSYYPHKFHRYECTNAVKIMGYDALRVEAVWRAKKLKGLSGELEAWNKCKEDGND